MNNIYVQELLKKWYIIAIVALVTAGLIVGEKVFLHKPVPVTGKMTFTEVVKIQRPDSFAQENNIIVRENIVSNTNMLTTRKGYLKHSSAIFDYQKCNANWAVLKESQRLQWLNSHYRIQYIGNDVYEVVLEYTSEEPKDGVYLKEKGAEMLHSFAEYANVAANDVFGPGELTVLKRGQLLEEHENTTEDQLIIKYIIIGVVLGSLLAGSLICVNTYKKIKK